MAIAPLRSYLLLLATGQEPPPFLGAAFGLPPPFFGLSAFSLSSLVSALRLLLDSGGGAATAGDSLKTSPPICSG